MANHSRILSHLYRAALIGKGPAVIQAVLECSKVTPEIAARLTKYYSNKSLAESAASYALDFFKIDEDQSSKRLRCQSDPQTNCDLVPSMFVKGEHQAANLAWAKAMIACNIPANVFNNLYFQNAIEITAKAQSYKLPSSSALSRTGIDSVLQSCKYELQEFLKTNVTGGLGKKTGADSDWK